MWSQLIKPYNKDEEVVNYTVKDDLTVIPVVRGDYLVFKREIPLFIKEHQYTLDKIYNKHFKDYNHISKKDFYIFAYANTNERYRRKLL
jgi:predicted nuclease of predicted toxin-antitoxin system